MAKEQQPHSPNPIPPGLSRGHDQANQIVIMRHYQQRNHQYRAALAAKSTNRANAALLQYAATAAREDAIPGLLVQNIIEAKDKIAEGELIKVVGFAWFEFIRLFEEDPDLIFRLDARQLEEMVAAAYEQQGATEVILTPRSG